MRQLLVSLLIPACVGFVGCAGTAVDNGDGSGLGDDGDSGNGGGGGSGSGSGDTGTAELCAPHGEERILTDDFRAYDVALSGNTVIAATTTAAGGNATTSKVIACPISGCDVQPAALAMPNRLAEQVEVAADGADVYWTEHVGTGVDASDRLIRATATGANRTTLIDYSTTLTINPIRPVVAGDHRVSFYAWGRQAGNKGEVRSATSTVAATSMLTVLDATFPALATADGYTAVWSQYTGGTPSPDHRIRGLDSTGAEVVASPPVEGVSLIETDGAAVMYAAGSTSSPHLYACVATDCTNPVDLTTTYHAYVSKFAFANDRAYFVQALEVCGTTEQKFAFVSCDVAALLDGSCEPTVHAVNDLHMINMRALSVGPTTAVYSSKLDGRLVRIDL
ncbi:MAG TPA: hypothetical protein VGM90_20540 [Kofleriaceae bacterium]|jgi:hypothetical protein